jgi:bifunctional non-homologous end joining protein LigD
MRHAKNSTSSAQPAFIKPMLCTLVKKPFNDPAYVYEVKWDGYRIMAYCQKDNVKLISRGGQNYTQKYPSIEKALKELALNCILDGEIVYIDEDGKPNFDRLQLVNGRNAPLLYYCFDILWKDGDSVMASTLMERKQILHSALKASNHIKFSEHFEDGLALFSQMEKLGMEGIIAKKRDSAYVPDERGKSWLKMTTEHRQEFVIGGWVESTKRNTFRTLLFGSYEDGKLKWKGHVGGGFKDHEMPAILKKLKALEIPENPFDSDVEYSEGEPHWVKPQLVANIKYATVTASGRIRKPATFLGFRNDKGAADVVTEKPMAVEAVKSDRSASSKIQDTVIKKQKLPTMADSNWPELEAQPIYNQDEFDIDSCTISLYNVDRELWKGVTKADLIQYYYSISKYILPHLKNRPLSLHVKPKGPYAPGLYIKDMEGREPDCAEIFQTPRKHKKAGKRQVIDYLVCNNAATLLYMINLGCIDVNPWLAVVEAPERPNFVVIDLDPTDDDFHKAIQSARATKEVIDKAKLKTFIKTSGKTGMHIFIPCTAFDFTQTRQIADHLCSEIHRLVPTITTTEVATSRRGNNVYLDPNQNGFTDTVASVYSVRPFKQPLVSTPIDWRELKDSLDPHDFSIASIKQRIEKKGDIFLATLDQKVATKNDSHLRQFL